MKFVTTVLFVSALSVMSAAGQSLALDSASVDLTTAANTTIATHSGSSGFLASVGCTVTGGPGGSLSAVVKTTLGSTVASYTVYSSSDVFATTLFPFLSAVQSLSGGWGGGEGDSFLIPIGVTYPGNFTVEVDVTSATSSGKLVCTALHS